MIIKYVYMNFYNYLNFSKNLFCKIYNLVPNETGEYEAAKNQACKF